MRARLTEALPPVAAGIKSLRLLLSLESKNYRLQPQRAKLDKMVPLLAFLFDKGGPQLILTLSGGDPFNTKSFFNMAALQRMRSSISSLALNTMDCDEDGYLSACASPARGCR